MQVLTPLNRLSILFALGTFLTLGSLTNKANAQVMTEGSGQSIFNETGYTGSIQSKPNQDENGILNECEVFYSSMKVQAIGKSNSIKIIWNALSSTEHDMFQLERSYDGVNFSLVTTVPFRKPKDGQNFGSYTVVDGSPEFDKNGVVYYRVVSTENDGSVAYSEIKSLELSSYSLASSSDL